MIDREFLGGFAFNRRHFHTNIDACIMVGYWGNRIVDNEEITLQGFDILPDDTFSDELIVPVKKIYELFSTKYYEKSDFRESTFDGILTGLNGLEADDSVKKRIKPLYSKDMLCYLVADSVGFDNPDAKSSLLVAGRYNGNGCYIHKTNYLEKLPMFAASRYITYNREWTERARIMKSADKAELFFADAKSGKLDNFFLKCLLFTCIEMQNHCRTFTGSDGRFYRNELCLDTTNGETVASKDIKKLKPNETEKKILDLYSTLLNHVKDTKEYKPEMTYGIYQIYDEIDTSFTDEITGKTVYNNIQVHSDLQAMKELCKTYYNAEIVPVLFEYEFLK